MKLNANKHLFRRLTAEDSAVVSGGSGSNDYPIFTTNDPTREGKIMNADGKGNDVTFSLPSFEIQNGDRKRNSNQDLGIGLPTSV